MGLFRLLQYLRPFKAKLYWSCLASIVNKVLDLMPPLLVAWIIDTVRGDAPSWITFLTGSDDAWTLAIFLSVVSVVIFTLESVFQWAYNFGFMTLAQDVQHVIRIDTYNHLQDREITFFENHRLGNTLSILNDDTNQLERFLNSGFNHILQLIVVIVFSCVVLLKTSWGLALIGMAPIPLIVWGSIKYQKLIAPKYAAVRETVGALSSQIENNLAGMMVIKSFTAESFESERVSESSGKYKQKNIEAIKINSVYVPLIRTAISISFASVLLIGSYWILEGYDILTVGELVLFSMLIQRMLWPLTTMGTVFDDYERARSSIHRIFGLLDERALIKDIENPKYLTPAIGGIAFKNVHFQYEVGPPVLNGVTFNIEPGQTIGIAGSTGSGKSTLIKLLFRFYEVNDGAVEIDDISVKTLAQDSLRKNISLVSQDVYLFYGSIYENIAYGLENVNVMDVVKASKLAQLDEFVQTLPNKYETLVGEKGIKLSGGQRQRLSIARAILKDAPIMILDEATSAVDTETERSIKENLDTLTAGKTALIIAHRLSTIKNADQIFVLESGQIVEQGSHSSLLAINGKYKALWALQVGE